MLDSARRPPVRIERYFKPPLFIFNNYFRVSIILFIQTMESIKISENLHVGVELGGTSCKAAIFRKDKPAGVELTRF
jgi:hypothetical protein